MTHDRRDRRRGDQDDSAGHRSRRGQGADACRAERDQQRDQAQEAGKAAEAGGEFPGFRHASGVDGARRGAGDPA